MQNTNFFLILGTLKNWFAQTCFVVLTSMTIVATPVNAANAIQSYENWSVFVEGPPKKACWAATSIGTAFNDTQTVLSVNRFHNSDALQVSVFSEKKLTKSTSIYLSISGRKYRMLSRNGQFFFPNKKSMDKQIISALSKVASAQNTRERIVYIGQGKDSGAEVRIDGFNAALNRVVQECSRS